MTFLKNEDSSPLLKQYNNKGTVLKISLLFLFSLCSNNKQVARRILLHAFVSPEEEAGFKRIFISLGKPG